jgi:TonB family protein
MEALSYLHAEGFVHGHLKPSNVLVIDDQVKLSSDCLHFTGKPVRHSRGPSLYYPPELATEPISPAADVWQLGITLIEALTQYPPVWDRAAQGDPEVPQYLPQPYFEIAQQCLRSDPARRCTLTDIRTRLQLPQPLPVVTAESEKTSPAWYRRPLIIAAIFFVVAFSATFLLRSHHTSPSPPTESQPSAETSPEPTTQSQTPVNRQSPAPASPPAANHPSNHGSLKGAVVDRVMPDLLPRAVESIHGQVNVKVRVMVDSNGNVSDATLDSPGPSKYFAKMALEAAQRWKFQPPQAKGAPVSSVWVLHFKFEHTGTEVTPVQTSP